jgi:beta-lactamase superfamily II metal-dependent hydrolase
MLNIGGMSVMEVHIFDVEHGSCNVVVAPSEEIILIDCGHNDTTGWRPSDWFLQNNYEISNLTITNTDEDHVSDLSNLYRKCNIKSLTRNWNLAVDWIEASKQEYGMGNGIKTLVEMIGKFTGPPLETNWGGMRIKRFCHSPEIFQDENSLSLVTFIHYGGIRIIFPGDLTKEAWEVFLRDNDFCNWLKDTNIFIASHHGRQDGYCSDVFKFCTPNIIIISDMSIKYDTQLVNYSNYANGISWSDGSIKKTITTRRNGKILIEGRNGSFYIETQR